MALARQQYITNFSNMWANKKLFYKLLNNLLFTLLGIHLAPKRNKNYRRFKKEYQDKKEKLNVSTLSNSKLKSRSSIRNKRRNAIKCESRNISKYEKRQMKDGRNRESNIAASQARIDYFKRTIVVPPTSDNPQILVNRNIHISCTQNLLIR